MKNEHIIRKTVLTLLVMLLFSLVAGTIVTVGELDGAAAKYAQAVVLLASAGCTSLFLSIRKKSLVEFGFLKPKSDNLKAICFAIPLFIISLSAFVKGIAVKDFNMLAANLLLALGAGFSEEIYFRGIICNLWRKRGVKSAIFVSASLFALMHLLNLSMGADLGYTLLQVIYTFVNGITFAVILLISKSIWPCIFLHFFHDACTFSANDIPPQWYIPMLIIWVSILLIYLFIMCYNRRKHIDSLL